MRHVSFRLDGHPFSPAVLLSFGCQAVPLHGEDADIPCTLPSAMHVAKVGFISETGLLIRGFHSVCVEHSHRLELDRPPFMQHLIGPHCGQPGTVFWVDDESCENGCQPEADADPEAVARITALVSAEYRRYEAQQKAAGLLPAGEKISWR